MAGRTPEVDQTAFGQKVDALVSGQVIAVVLGLDVLDANTLGHLELVHLDLVVEVTDVTHDRLVLHLEDVVHGDDVAVARGGDVNVANAEGALEGVYLEAFHRGLQGVDGVDLGDHDTGAVSAQAVGRALADVTVAANHGHLASDHDIGGALQTVGQRLAATIEVVELRLGDRVVHVDGRNQQLALLGELVEAMHAGGGLLGDAAPSLNDLGPNAGLLLGHALEEVLDHLLLVRTALGVNPLVTLLELIALVDEQGHVATVVDDQLRTLVTGVDNGLEGQLPVLFERFALPSEHRSARRGDGRGGVILG